MILKSIQPDRKYLFNDHVPRKLGVYVYIAHENVVWSGARAGRHTCVRCTCKQKRITVRKRFGQRIFSEKYTNIFFDRYENL